MNTLKNQMHLESYLNKSLGNNKGNLLIKTKKEYKTTLTLGKMYVNVLMINIEDYTNE